MVAVRGVDIIVFGLPPTDHSIWRGCTWTLTEAARVIKPSHFDGAQRAIKNFRLIDQSIHDVRCADVATNEQVRSSGKNRSDHGGLGSDLHSVYINFQIA